MCAVVIVVVVVAVLGRARARCCSPRRMPITAEVQLLQSLRSFQSFLAFISHLAELLDLLALLITSTATNHDPSASRSGENVRVHRTDTCQ